MAYSGQAHGHSEGFKRDNCHADIFSKYNCSVRKHIEEGICLTAINAFLCRNVTIR